MEQQQQRQRPQPQANSPLTWAKFSVLFVVLSAGAAHFYQQGETRSAALWGIAALATIGAAILFPQLTPAEEADPEQDATPTFPSQ